MAKPGFDSNTVKLDVLGRRVRTKEAIIAEKEAMAAARAARAAERAAKGQKKPGAPIGWRARLAAAQLNVTLPAPIVTTKKRDKGALAQLPPAELAEVLDIAFGKKQS